MTADGLGSAPLEAVLPLKIAEGPGGPPFSVLQSNTGVTAHEVWQKVEKFLS
jgi:hypothetical protein